MEYSLLSKEVQVKITKTNIEKFGFSNVSKSDIIKNRKKETFKNYGVEHPMHTEEIKDKVKETNLERFGVEYPSQLEEIKEKTKETTKINMELKIH